MNKAVDFVKKQIDEFEKRIFGRGKSVKTAANESQKYKSLNGIKKETGKHIWSGKDKYVPELANAIEKKYPGRVRAVEKIIKGSDGKIITDLDIDLDDIVIQVKSGSAKGLTAQMLRTAKATGRTVISYTPDIAQSAAVLRNVRQNGFQTFTDMEELLKYLANH